MNTWLNSEAILWDSVTGFPVSSPGFPAGFINWFCSTDRKDSSQEWRRKKRRTQLWPFTRYNWL